VGDVPELAKNSSIVHRILQATKLDCGPFRRAAQGFHTATRLPCTYPGVSLLQTRSPTPHPGEIRTEHGKPYRTSPLPGLALHTVLSTYQCRMPQCKALSIASMMIRRYCDPSSCFRSSRRIRGIKLNSTITGDSGRTYPEGILLRRHPQDSKFDIFKTESVVLWDAVIVV
jgi:hypothetical protein